MSATTNLGKVSVTPKGAWAITNEYEILDIVTSGGSSYLAKQDVPTGVSLSNTTYWIMIAEKGDGGEVTSASASISGGYGTPGVTVTAGGTAHERTLAFAFTNLRGEKGETGNGIDSVYKTGTSGLVDTYTILFTDGNTYEFEVNNGTASIDNTLTKSGWAADAKVVGDTKASIDGFYETMGVGVADNLTPYSEDSGATQSIPFIAQGTGCGNGESVVDTGSYLQFKKKLGNTACVNQPIRNGNFADSSYWSPYDSSAIDLEIANGIGKVTFKTATGSYYRSMKQAFSPVIGHKYLLKLSIRVSAPGGYAIDIAGSAQGKQYSVSTANVWTDIYKIIDTAGGSASSNILFEPLTGVGGVGDTMEYRNIAFPDLTLWFGSNDRIPSDLLSHPENWGRYYAGSLAYAAGYLDSADGSILTSIHRNIWDEEWEQGGLDTSTGSTVTNNYSIRSKNFIPCIPNTKYYCYTTNAATYIWFYDGQQNYIGFSTSTANQNWSTPSNCHYIKFRSGDNDNPLITYNHDITLSLYYPGEPGYNQYYPFSVLAEVDTGSEVLRSAGAVADEKTPDGTITRRVGVVDLGTLTWTKSSSGNKFYATVPSPYYKMVDTGTPAQCAIYINDGIGTSTIGYYPTVDKAFRLAYTSSPNPGSNTFEIYVHDEAYSTKESFEAAMSGVYLYYELATPTTEQGTAFAENIPCDDFGSMYWTQTKGIPQGNEIFYPVDYKASIDTLYNRVEGDMGAIVIDSQLEVVADRIPEAPSSDGTYTLKATVSSGTKTYSWVADE